MNYQKKKFWKKNFHKKRFLIGILNSITVTLYTCVRVNKANSIKETPQNSFQTCSVTAKKVRTVETK